jgi:hypothetical protein
VGSKFRVEVLDRDFLEQKFLPKGDRIASFDHAQLFGKTTQKNVVLVEGPFDRGAYALAYVYCGDARVRSNPPGPAHAAAILGDGSRFAIAEPEDMRRFYARVRGSLSPRELAGLLLEFQSDGGHRFIETEDDLRPFQRWLVGPIPDLVMPPILESDPLRLEFCSARDNPWVPPSVVRWSAHEAEGRLGWSHRTLWEVVRSR